MTRFITWYELERGTGAHRAATAAVMKAKTEAVTDAQRRGVGCDRYAAGEILALVFALANMWQRKDADYLSLVPADRRRALIVEAVRRLAAP